MLDYLLLRVQHQIMSLYTTANHLNVLSIFVTSRSGHGTLDFYIKIYIPSSPRLLSAADTCQSSEEIDLYVCDDLAWVNIFFSFYLVQICLWVIVLTMCACWIIPTTQYSMSTVSRLKGCCYFNLFIEIFFCLCMLIVIIRCSYVLFKPNIYHDPTNRRFVKAERKYKRKEAAKWFTAIIIEKFDLSLS